MLLGFQTPFRLSGYDFRYVDHSIVLQSLRRIQLTSLLPSIVLESSQRLPVMVESMALSKKTSLFQFYLYSGKTMGFWQYRWKTGDLEVRRSVDGDQLMRLMIRYNLGVSVEHTYEVKRIDKISLRMNCSL